MQSITQKNDIAEDIDTEQKRSIIQAMIKWSEKLKEAWELAKEGHESIGQKRKYNNEPYFTHPLAVAEIVS